MGMFDSVKTDAAIKEPGDNLGGFGVMDSDAYKFTIEKAFGTKSAGGAIALNLHMRSDTGNILRHQIYTTTKKGLNTYKDKEGKDQYLPGFNIVNAICLLAGEKPISDMVEEEKTIMLYDFKEKKEVPTKVDMVMDLLGKEIILGVVKQIVDKTTLNTATGKYEPTGETREINDIDAVFRASDQMTKAEITAKATDPVFLEKWVERRKGKVVNRASKTGVKAGAPSGAGAAAPAKSLFK